MWIEVCDGFCLAAPDNCPLQVSLVMKACWAIDPMQRPAFSKLPQLLGDPTAFNVSEQGPHHYANFDNQLYNYADSDNKPYTAQPSTFLVKQELST